MDLYKVNNIVDINNLISLETGHSLGCVDLAKVQGDVVFTKGNAGDYYEGIGRGQINLENMPVFKDDEGYFASTTSDSVRTQVTEESKHIMMMVICFEGDSKLNEYIEKININAQTATLKNVAGRLSSWLDELKTRVSI